MRKTRRLVGAFTALALVLAACGNGDDPDAAPDDTAADDPDDDVDPEDREEVTVEMWFNGTPDAHGEVLEELIPQFEEEHPHITVDWELTDWDTYQQDISTAAAGGTLPDIIFAFSNLVPGYAERDLLADHSQWFDEDEFVDVTVELTSWEGEWKMLPTWFSATTLHYRGDLIEEAGFDPDEGMDTWDDLLEWAEGATIRDNGDIEQLGYFTGTFDFNRVNNLTTAWDSNNVSIFNEDGTEAAFNSPEGVEAGEFLRELSQCCDQVGAIEAENIGLGQGQTAMVSNNFGFREWREEFPELIEDGHAYMQTFPQGPSGDGPGGAVTGANVIGITNDADHPDEAAELLRWLVVEPDQIIQLAGLGGSIPATAAAEGHEYFEENPFVEEYRQIAEEDGRSDIAHPDFADIESILNDLVDDLLLSDEPVDELLDGAAADINEVLDRSGIPAAG